MGDGGVRAPFPGRCSPAAAPERRALRRPSEARSEVLWAKHAVPLVTCLSQPRVAPEPSFPTRPDRHRPSLRKTKALDLPRNPEETQAVRAPL